MYKELSFSRVVLNLYYFVYLGLEVIFFFKVFVKVVVLLSFQEKWALSHMFISLKFC